MPIRQFGEYLPDIPGVQNPGLVVAKNVIPRAGGYGPLRSTSVISSNALTAAATGAAKVRTYAGVVQQYAGDSAALYELVGAAWGDISKAGGYSPAATDRWRFALYGDWLIATNGTDPAQRFDTTSGTLFEDLPNAPKFKYPAVVRNFLVAGDVTDDGDFKLAWSGNNDSTEWTPGTLSSGKQQFPSGGKLNAVTGGEFGVVFQEEAVTRMSFVGGTLVFQFDELEGANGCVAPGSLVRVGPFSFYLSNLGFEVFNGAQSERIGKQRIDSTFFKRWDRDRREDVYAGLDTDSNSIFWLYPSLDAGTRPDRLIIYSLAENRWSEGEADLEALIVDDATRDLTLEELDQLGDLDSLTQSLDSGSFQLPQAVLAGFDSSHKLVRFNGLPLASEIETGEFQPITENRARIDELRPITDATPTLSVKHRNKLSVTQSTRSAGAVNNNGVAPIRLNDRYMAFKQQTAADEVWDFTAGVQYKAAPGGR